METQRAVLQEILERAPGSIRELAREAGLTHAALTQARDGLIRLTPESIDKLAVALARWGQTCVELAHRLKTAEPEGKDETHE